MSTSGSDTVLNERLRHVNSVLRAIRTVNQIIVRVADQQKVAQYVCENLVAIESYQYAWIALLDAAGNPVYATGAGYSGPDPWPTAKSEIKQLPFCAQRALDQPGVAVTKNSVVECNGCPLAAEATRFSALSIRLAYQDELYGIMTVSMPKHISEDFEEHSLLLEMAGDIAFALHNLQQRSRRRRAEERAARFTEIFESTLDEIYIFDAKTLYFVEVNHGARKNLGYSLAELRQMTPLDLKPEFTRQSFDLLLDPVRHKKQDKLQFITVHRRKDGSLYPVEVHLQLSTLHDRLVFFAIILDITERKQAEAEIRLKNQELGLLNRIISASAASSDLYEILEITCRELALFFEVPQSAAALLNSSKTEAVVRAEYLAEGRPSGLNHVIPAANNPVFDYLLTHKTPLVIDDTRQDPRLAAVRKLIQARGTVSILLVPLMVNNDVVGSLGVDAVTSRTFSEAEVNLAQRVAEQLSGPLARARMADRQRRLIAAVEQSVESMVITDLEANIIYVNPAFEKISGYTTAEIMGRNPRVLQSGIQDQAFYRKMWDTLTAGQVWQGRMVNKKKDGTLYTEEATITPVRDERGKIINYVAVKRDITDELSLQEQYYQAQKMESLGRLTGGVAHDFNNLLTAINGFAELLKMQISANDPLLPMVENILRSGNRATALVRQLLAFSRKQDIKPQLLDLNQAVTDLDKMLRRVIGEDINLKTILAPTVSAIKADPTQLEQTLVNLVVNARDVMPHGGKITIETANVRLDEAYAASHFETRPGDYVMLAVSDTGPGMTEAVMKQIFEPFFTTKEQGKGTGLGLATVYGIVKQNQGDIRVYSEPGVGTTFKVYFPVADALPQTVLRPVDMPVITGNETILLVEDDEAVRLLVAQMLQELGYQIITATGGIEALQLAQEHRDTIDLMLTDVVMPEVSGKALAEEMLTEIPGLKVLYMSGYTENAIAHHGVLDDGIAFIAKPFYIQGMAVKLRELLDD